MKKVLNTSIALLVMIMVGLAFTTTSCEDSDGSPDIKAGDPVLEIILPDTGQGGALITVKGSGLGDMRSIVFEKGSVPAYVMSTLNTESAILFRVPSDAVGGLQKVTFTNSDGKTMVVENFNVLAYPQMTAASNYNYVAGDEITITGTNLNDVTSVKISGTSDLATIVSKEKSKMVIEMPATTAKNAQLEVTNVTGMKKTPFEMVCLSNCFVCYTDAWGSSSWGGGVQSWSYSCTVSEQSTETRTGTKALKVAYTDGGLSLFLGSDWGSPMLVFTDRYTPQYFSFWAKGDGKAADLTIITDSPPWDGSYSGAGTITVSVPADVWTYFKIPASTWTGKYGRLNVKCTATTSVYFDDLVYI